MDFLPRRGYSDFSPGRASALVCTRPALLDGHEKRKACGQGCPWLRQKACALPHGRASAVGTSAFPDGRASALRFFESRLSFVIANSLDEARNNYWLKKGESSITLS